MYPGLTPVPQLLTSEYTLFSPEQAFNLWEKPQLKRKALLRTLPVWNRETSWWEVLEKHIDSWVGTEWTEWTLVFY